MEELQEQMQDNRRARKQIQVDMVTVDTQNCLCAEAERLVNYCNVKANKESIPKSFTRCLNQETDDSQCMMMNIEGFATSLDAYTKIAAKDQTIVPLFPVEYLKDVELWVKSIEAIEDPQQFGLQVEVEVLKFILDKMSKQEPMCELPQELQERILSQKKRDEYCEEIVKSGQSNILAMVRVAQNISDKTKEQADQAFDSKKKIKANKTLLFKIDDQIEAFRDRKKSPESSEVLPQNAKGSEYTEELTILDQNSERVDPLEKPHSKEVVDEKVAALVELTGRHKPKTMSGRIKKFLPSNSCTWFVKLMLFLVLILVTLALIYSFDPFNSKRAVIRILFVM